MAEQEAAEKTLALFDTYWFHHLILLPPPSPPQPPSPEPTAAAASQPPGPPPSDLRHRRSRSDEAVAAAAAEDLEPLKIPSPAKLETILSGKEGDLAAGRAEARRERRRSWRRRRRQPRGRSMSELEVEEVKGLRDLGFTFSDAEVDTELESIVPGLRRRGSEPAEAAAARPYLSEAWEAMGEEEEEAMRGMLRNWRIPEDGGRADLKENLRLWAHTVASAVR